ncbi:NUDIX hydrolase [Isoptericola jiangsuensis]|uniref:NUDIX hydrolase n=1 Tax=Isoptericola jiangsuensis TaxID=548579 RepID=UPI000BF6BC40|nr:NUDIX hydrolase [Isoptericola jiangsuensis]
MPATVVTSRPDAPWLPPGGRADVVLDPDGAPPAPTGLVRLLLRSGDDVFCVPRDGGTGRLDLPTCVVPDHDDGRTAALGLARAVLGRDVVPTMVGYVRNEVLLPGAASGNYPWPAPVCHFTVWQATGTPHLPGTWLPTDAASPLADRHWWPLLAAPSRLAVTS